MDAQSSNDAAVPQVVSRRLIHHGRKYDFEMLTVKRPSGKTMEREVVRHPGAVVVVPLTDDGQLVLIRNYRVAVEENLWECCAGTLEPPEPPEVCAGRELIEETGYSAATMRPLGWFYTTPGMTDEKMYAFAATGLKHVGQHLEEDETIEVRLVPPGLAMEMIGTGEIRDGKSMVALVLAERAGVWGSRDDGMMG